MRGVLYSLKYLKKLCGVVLLLDFVKNIEEAYVITLTNYIVFGRFGIKGLEIANDGLFDLCHPQAVKIAVRIRRYRLFVGKRKGNGRCFAYLKALALTALVGLKIYPKILCSETIGCSTEPTVTVTVFPST